VSLRQRIKNRRRAPSTRGAATIASGLPDQPASLPPYQPFGEPCHGRNQQHVVSQQDNGEPWNRAVQLNNRWLPSYRPAGPQLPPSYRQAAAQLQPSDSPVACQLLPSYRPVTGQLPQLPPMLHQLTPSCCPATAQVPPSQLPRIAWATSDIAEPLAPLCNRPGSRELQGRLIVRSIYGPAIFHAWCRLPETRLRSQGASRCSARQQLP